MPKYNTTRVAYLSLQRMEEGMASYAHVTEIVRGLGKRGANVKVFSIPSGDDSFASRHFLLRILMCFWIQIKLWSHLRSCDILYVRGHCLAFLAALGAKFLRKPIIHEINGTFIDLDAAYPKLRIVNRGLKRVGKWQYMAADGLIAVTPGLVGWLEELGVTCPIVCIPNGADDEHFHPNAAADGYSPQYRYVAFVAALAPWQGVDTVIRAVNRASWPRSVRLVILGDGEERWRIDSAVLENPLIEYLGRIPYDCVPAFVAGSVCSLSPQTDYLGRSQYGLFPLKVFEGMACGVPVVVTDFAGQADIVRKYDCGLVIPPEDDHALADAVSRLASNEEMRHAMGQNGRVAVEQELSWDRRAAETYEFLTRFSGVSSKQGQLAEART